MSDEEGLKTTQEVWARVDALEIDVDKSKYPTGRLRFLDISNLSEETGRSVHWLLTGERHPYEPKLVYCHNPYPFDE